MKSKKRHILHVPIRFHTVLKYEATLEGKTMTKYMDDIADELEDENGTVRNFLKRQKKTGKNEKKKFTFEL